MPESSAPLSMNTTEAHRSNRQPEGYPKFAQFMAGKDHVILKRFQKLAVLDLLYRQAELYQIQDQLQKQAIKDANESDGRQLFDRDWWHLRNSEDLGLNSQQWHIVLEMRNAAVHQYKSVASGPRPSEQQRSGLHAYAYRPSTGGYCDFLGRDLGDHYPYPSILSADNQQDLLFLGEDLDDDLLSRILSGPVLKIFNWIWKHFQRPAATDEESTVGGMPPSTSLYYYSDRRIRIALNIFGAVFSSIIPTLSIIVLFFVHEMLARLGLVVLFTFIFSLTMCLATKAKRYEIYAATAAFASVQVVFVGTTGSS
ncbi:hypothetical protein HD806DRAFT_532594 [Xylariaceae sp. AK1471]|nr:hypothetical protein HD806DRAFT_532594 [Xylariaceae sp. AK1471]